MLRRFVAGNKRLVGRIEPLLPQAREDIYQRYLRTVALFMNARPGQVVADVGGGARCPFAQLRAPGLGTTIVAVDISADELAANCDADEQRVADIMRTLPFGDGDVDIVTSRYVLEHLPNLEDFIIQGRRVLKDGGYFIHLFPARYSPHAVVNRMIPNRLARTFLKKFYDDSRGGFPAFYDRCYHSALRSLLDKHGFETMEIHASYYQSKYYGFLLPLFAMSAGYEMLLQALDARDLAAHLLVVARKKADFVGTP